MSDGYGSYTAACGRCGNSFTGTGVVGDMRAERWLKNHEKNECRLRTPEEVLRANWEMEQSLTGRIFMRSDRPPTDEEVEQAKAHRRAIDERYEAELAALSSEAEQALPDESEAR